MVKRAWNFIDRTGHKYGRLTVLEIDHSLSHSKKLYWKCLCDCGATGSYIGGNIANGHVQSCGCLQKESVSEIKTTHGLAESNTYKTWLSMKERCTNPNSKSYSKYGAIGVEICERWISSFENFLEDMGERPNGMTLNRVGGVPLYSKDTCEWATSSVQGYDQKKKNTNTSGKSGVSSTKYGTWTAYIDCNKRLHLGTFKTFEAAVAAREKAEIEYFGFNKE